MKRTILLCGLLMLGLALLGGCHTYDNAYMVPDYNYDYPANPYAGYPYYYPYPYVPGPTYYAYPAYYPYSYYPYYPYYPYYGWGAGFGYSTVIIGGGGSGNSGRVFRGGTPRGGGGGGSGGRTFR